MPENAIPLVSCNAYGEKSGKKFPKIICAIQRGPRVILCFYVARSPIILTTQVEYHIDNFIKDFPFDKPFCIDGAGRNHGVDESVFVSPHDINNAVIAACQTTSQDWKSQLSRQV